MTIKNKIPIVVAISESLNPSFFIRHLEPLSLLANQNKIFFLFRQLEEIIYEDLLKADLIIFNRCREDLAVKIAEFCQANEIPFIYDLDDDIFNLPRYSFDVISSNQRANAYTLIKQANLVTTSTKTLAIKLSKFNKTKIIKNTINFTRYQAKHPKKYKKNDSFNLLISVSDNLPLSKNERKNFIAALNNLQIKYPKINIFSFQNPQTQLEIKNLICLGQLPFADYSHFLQDYNFHLALIPISSNKDNDFIASKSIIKFISYSCAGIPCLFSSDSLYEKLIDKKFAYFAQNNSLSWEKQINKIINNYQLANKKAKLAQDNVKQHYNLDNNIINYDKVIFEALTKTIKRNKINQRIFFEHQLMAAILKENKLGKISLKLIHFIAAKPWLKYLTKKIVKI